MIFEKKTITNYFDYFNVFFSASVIYALLSVILIFNNYNGIGKTLFAILTCIYSIYCLTNSGIKLKRGAVILMIFIILLSLSIFNTSDALVVFINEILMFISLIVLFIHSYVNDEEWQLLEYIKSFINIVFEPLALIGRITPNGEMNYERNFYCNLPNCNNAPNNDHVNINVNGEARESNSVCKTNIFKIGYVLIGILISMFLLGIILPLLFSADQLFEELFITILESTNIINFNVTDVFGIMALFTFLLLASFLGIKYLNLGKAAETRYRERVKTNELIGITILVVISIVYMLFSFVQIFGLFLNKMQLPLDETYSSYARNGFFQLLNVAFINLVMIVASFYLFNRSGIIKILLTFISGSTYIMLASSAYRLILYIQEYQLTKLRLYALWGLVLVLFGLTGAVISIYKEKFKFVRYGFITLLTLWTIFSFMRPEYLIAKYNLSNTINDAVDENYIASFSSDASEPIYEYIVKNNISKTNEEDYKSGCWGKYEIADFFTYDNGIDNFGLKFNLSKWYFNKCSEMIEIKK